MSKTTNLGLEVVSDTTILFPTWRASLNGIGEGATLSNAQIIDAYAGTINSTLQTLNTTLQNIEERGRFLSLWNASTGMPLTEPSSIPYQYKTGDFFIVHAVGPTNYKPSGNAYTGVASTAVESTTLKTGNTYWFDGTSWALQAGTTTLPDPPTTAGTYALYCTVDGSGNATFSWAT